MAGRRQKRDRGSNGAAAARAVEDDGAGLIEQDLTESELTDRRDELISWLVKREQVEARKAQAVEKLNAELKLAKQRIHVLTREIDTKKAYVDPQVPMPYPDPGTNDSQAAAS